MSLGKASPQRPLEYAACFGFTCADCWYAKLASTTPLEVRILFDQISTSRNTRRGVEVFSLCRDPLKRKNNYISTAFKVQAHKQNKVKNVKKKIHQRPLNSLVLSKWIAQSRPWQINLFNKRTYLEIPKPTHYGPKLKLVACEPLLIFFKFIFN